MFTGDLTLSFIVLKNNQIYFKILRYGHSKILKLRLVIF